MRSLGCGGTSPKNTLPTDIYIYISNLIFSYICSSFASVLNAIVCIFGEQLRTKLAPLELGLHLFFCVPTFFHVHSILAGPFLHVFNLFLERVLQAWENRSGFKRFYIVQT